MAVIAINNEFTLISVLVRGEACATCVHACCSTCCAVTESIPDKPFCYDFKTNRPLNKVFAGLVFLTDASVTDTVLLQS